MWYRITITCFAQFLAPSKYLPCNNITFLCVRLAKEIIIIAVNMGKEVGV